MQKKLVSDGRCSCLSGRIIDLIRANSVVVFLYGRVNVSPWVRCLLVNGVSNEVFVKYSEENIFLSDPYISASLARGGAVSSGVQLIDYNDRDVMCSCGTELYWRFLGRHNLGNCAAFTRCIGDNLLLTIGLHGCTQSISGAAEDIQSLSDAVMARILETMAWQSDFLPNIAHAINRSRAGPDHIQLSAREKQIIRLVMRGLRNKQVAHELSISENTVESHLRRIYQKLSVQNRTSLMNRMSMLDHGHAAATSQLVHLKRTPSRTILEF